MNSVFCIVFMPFIKSNGSSRNSVKPNEIFSNGVVDVQKCPVVYHSSSSICIFHIDILIHGRDFSLVSFLVIAFVHLHYYK